VTDFTAEIQAAMQASMDSEDARRLLASRTPGLGSALPMEQPAAGPAVGKYGLPGLEVTGEGYAMTAPDAVQHKAYGPARPVYAPDVVGGIEPAAVRVLLRARAAADGIAVVSPPARPSLWRRLLRRS
jgi:hypothetical protein